MGYKSYKKDVEKAIQSGIKKGLELIGMDLVSYASKTITKNGNIDTGRLRASIASAVDTDIQKNKEYFGDINPKDMPHGKLPKNVLQYGSNVKYAPKIERDYPFLKPALTKNKNIYQKYLNEMIEEALKWILKILNYKYEQSY